MANKDSTSLEDQTKTTKHKQAVKGEALTSKLTHCFRESGRKSEDDVEFTMAFCRENTIIVEQPNIYGLNLTKINLCSFGAYVNDYPKTNSQLLCHHILFVLSVRKSDL